MTYRLDDAMEAAFAREFCNSLAREFGAVIRQVPIPSTPAPLRSPAQQAPHPLGAPGPAPITPPAAQTDFADAGISPEGV